MRISFSTGTFYHRPLAYSLRLARALGYDGVEYVVGPDYSSPASNRFVGRSASMKHRF
jgi:sugar phosphate isomerase/epimerase